MSYILATVSPQRVFLQRRPLEVFYRIPILYATPHHPPPSSSRSSLVIPSASSPALPTTSLSFSLRSALQLSPPLRLTSFPAAVSLRSHSRAARCKWRALLGGALGNRAGRDCSSPPVVLRERSRAGGTRVYPKIDETIALLAILRGGPKRNMADGRAGSQRKGPRRSKI